MPARDFLCEFVAFTEYINILGHVQNIVKFKKYLLFLFYGIDIYYKPKYSSYFTTSDTVRSKASQWACYPTTLLDIIVFQIATFQSYRSSPCRWCSIKPIKLNFCPLGSDRFNVDVSRRTGSSSDISTCEIRRISVGCTIHDSIGTLILSCLSVGEARRIAVMW